MKVASYVTNFCILLLYSQWILYQVLFYICWASSLRYTSKCNISRHFYYSRDKSIASSTNNFFCNVVILNYSLLVANTMKCLHVHLTRFQTLHYEPSPAVTNVQRIQFLPQHLVRLMEVVFVEAIDSRR